MELRMERGNKKFSITRKEGGRYYLGIERISPFLVVGLPFEDEIKLVVRLLRELESA